MPNLIYSMESTVITLLCSTLILSGCGYSDEDLADARMQGREEMQKAMMEKMDDALSSCEEDMLGVLMDDGCLEDEFLYQGDFWNCELSQPTTVVDGDCVRYEIGL